MFKTIKKVLLSSLSILGIGFIFWLVFLLNPSLSYANKTEFDFVTIYHNQDLDSETESVIIDAVNIIKESTIFHDEVSIDLCLNDDKVYPKLHPLMGNSLAFALLDKTIVRNCTIDFSKNTAVTKWKANNYETRIFDLTYLLAHEFTHNLQADHNFMYLLKSTKGININWKLEGHADYIAREYKNDGKLKERINLYLLEEKKEHNGFPVFELKDGTKQILSYFKYSLVIQYLLEEKQMNFDQVCKLEAGLDELYTEMLEWNVTE